MTRDELYLKIWNALEDDPPFFGEIQRQRPHLAHYTSMQVLEQILANEEIWFSHPLLMNDIDEVYFGIDSGLQILQQNSRILEKSLRTTDRFEKFHSQVRAYQIDFEKHHLKDSYIFCLSEHDCNDNDGLLSMWRGYGGNGNGAALVFDTSKLTLVDGSPFVLDRVRYGTYQQQLSYFGTLAERVAGFLREINITDDELYLVAGAYFTRLKQVALFTKHSGFREEKEWRVVYFSELDRKQLMKERLGYVNGPRRVEPKLKLKLEHIEGISAPDLSMDNLLTTILLGPMASSEFAHGTIGRMLDLIGKPQFKDRLVTSSIPFRSEPSW